MTRTVLSFHVGQCGVQIALPKWELFANEHNIGYDGYVPESVFNADFEDHTFQTFFYQTPSGRLISRAILIDTDTYVLDYVKQSKYKGIFSADYIVGYNDDSANNFALGYHSIGKRIHARVVDKIRKLAEQSDSIMGFLIANSIGGGTGSGYSTCLLENIRSEVFGDKKLTSMGLQIFPSPTLSPIVVEPYNAAFAIKNQLDHLNIVTAYDNEALYDISKRLLPSKLKPTYKSINEIIAKSISGMTSSFRFNGTLNSDMNALYHNLVPQPDLHFIMASTTPIDYQDDQHQTKVYDITFEAFRNFNSMVRCMPNDGKYMRTFLLYRGDVNAIQVKKSVSKLLQLKNMKFVQKNPTFRFRTDLNFSPVLNVQGSKYNDSCRSLTCMMNNTAINTSFERIHKQFSSLYKKRCFVHWYASAGLDKREFTAVDECFTNISSIYRSILETDKVPVGYKRR